MAQDTMKFNFAESSVANADTTIDGIIDDFWASVDLTHTASAIEMDAKFEVQVSEGTIVKHFPLSFRWFEDETVQNTRMKNIVGFFLAAITSMEGASSFTIVQAIRGTITLTITYT